MLDAQHHDDVDAVEPVLESRVRSDAFARQVAADRLDAARQQRVWRDQPDSRAEPGQAEDVRARHARVLDIADDRDLEPLDHAFVAADRRGVEQRLGRMLVLAVAGVDHRAADLLRQQRSGARRRMADHEQVRLHGVQRHRRVDQGLALGDRGGAGAHVDHVGAQPLAGQLEGALGAGRILEEQVHQRPALEQVELLRGLAVEADESVGEIQEVRHLHLVQIGRRKEMPFGEREGPLQDIVQTGGRVSH